MSTHNIEAKMVETFLDYSESLKNLGFQVSPQVNGFFIVKNGKVYTVTDTVDGIRAFYFGYTSKEKA